MKKTGLRVLAGSLALGLSVTRIFAAATVYEPFDYPAGGLNGAGGTTEVGLTSNWTASADSLLVSNSLTYGSLPTSGNSIGNLGGGMNRFGGARAVDSAALAANGWLADGAAVWFSAIMGVDTNGNRTNSKLGLSLANGSFNGGNGNYWIVDDGAQLGSGLGVYMPAGVLSAAQFRDSSFGAGTVGIVSGSSTATQYNSGEQGLLVGKFTWGATSNDLDTIELYQPATDLAMPASPVSTLSVVVDQTTYDTITWARGDKVLMDEIRFGVSYNDVVTADSSSDVDAPTPNPMTFFEAPIEASSNSIRMAATVAEDLSGVEYYFACTAGAGNDSGWQSSRTYIDTGLTEGSNYTYTVKARDRSPATNETAASSGFSATPQAVDETPPSPNPMTWADPPTGVSSNAIAMTATTATDANPVEYFFENITLQSNSGWQDSPTYTNTGLSSFASYSYRVKARDKAYLQNEGAWSAILPAVTFPTHGSAASLTDGQFFILASQNSGGTVFDISVTPGVAKFNGIWGSAGPAYGHFGDGMVKDYCFFTEVGTTDVIESYAAGSAGLISTNLAISSTIVEGNGSSDLWETTDPGDDFSSAADVTSGTMLLLGDATVTGSIDVSGIKEGLVYFIYGAYRTTPRIDITMSGSGQTDVTLPSVGDNDAANNFENYLYSVGFQNNGAYDSINYTYTCSNARFMGVVLWERPQPPSGTVIIVR